MRYKWAGLGDLNAFFGLMLDNVVNLVILAGILVHVFEFPAHLVYGRMFPGTALGVMFGDLVYTWLAFRLARKTGRNDVTAMPLGLDAPSTIGMAFAVLGPAFLAAKASGLDPESAGLRAWHVGMATMVLVGVFKLGMSFVGPALQRWIPSAGLLGTLAGIGIALLGTLQFGELLHEPIVGFAALGVLWYSLISKIKLPFGAPEVLVSAALGTALFYALWAVGWNHTEVKPDAAWVVALPLPSLGFLDGMKEAVFTYLPVAVPFAVLTVVGGINVTESARLAGDDYDTREILLTEAFATLIAGVCGGVAQSTPYIGQPAYKAMGGKAAYTLMTGLFVGLGGVLGFIPFLAQILPKAALVPILLFVGVDIAEQAFHATPKRHAMAVSFAMFPNIAQLVQIILSQANGALLTAAIDPAGTMAAAKVSPDFVGVAGVFVMLAHGFILTGMLWGGILAFLADRKALEALILLGVCAVFTLFGVMHSVDPSGGVYLPWKVGSTLPIEWAVGYGIVGLTVAVLSRSREFRQPAPAE
jgi:AGZA family xanthine/uracil permease-like MFS transporter